MKTVFTLLIGLAATFMASGQTIGIYIQGSPIDVSGTVVDVAGGEETHEEFDVINESASTLLLRVKRTKLQTVSGATDYLCWGLDEASGICYLESTVGPNDPWTTPDEFTFAPNDTGYLSTHHQANGNVGVAMYRYYIVDDMGDPLDSIDVRYTSTVSIENNEEPSFKAYPNPATTELFIDMSGNGNDNYSVRLYNIMGSMVLSRKLTTGKNQLSVSNLNSGIYFYSIYRNGKVIETKKVVVQ